MKSDEHYAVILEGKDPNGTADLVTMLLNENLENFPGRIKIARGMSRPVAVHVTESGATATVVFNRDQAVVYNGLVGTPGVVIKANMAQFRDASKLKIRAGGLMPVGFVTKRGGIVLKQVLMRQLVVNGLLTHPFLALRFIALISIAK